MARQTRLPGIALVTIVLIQFGTLLAARHGHVVDTREDFAFLQPWIDLEQEERDTLAQRGVVVRSLSASGAQISVIAVCAIALSPDGFLSAVRSGRHLDGNEMKRGGFSHPPTMRDLAGVSLDEGDIDRLRRCEPGDCALNLADFEMSALQAALNEESGVQQAFRKVILNRVRQYQSGGLAALSEYHDRKSPVRPARIFSEILQQTPYLEAHLPHVKAYLERFPSGEQRPAESSLLWSKVRMNRKPVVTVRHVTVFRPSPAPLVPAVLVAGNQVYASRYINGDLTLTMLFADGARPGSYLVHVHRSHLDELSGRYRWIKRAVLEGPIKAEAAETMAALRDRLERQAPRAR